VRDGAKVEWAYAVGDGPFTAIPLPPFAATEGRWVGAKVGLFVAGAPGAFADFADFRVAALSP